VQTCGDLSGCGRVRSAPGRRISDGSKNALIFLGGRERLCEDLGVQMGIRLEVVGYDALNLCVFRKKGGSRDTRRAP
jgi:hypothetical protein